MTAARLVQRQLTADAGPAAHIALARIFIEVFIATHRDHRSVTLQADRMIGSGCDRNNIRPAAHIALAVIIISYRDHRSVTLQADRMTATSCDRNNISPAAHIALASMLSIPVAVFAHRDHRSVTLQADCMPSTSCDQLIRVPPSVRIMLLIRPP